jgi:hypothetical protein
MHPAVVQLTDADSPHASHFGIGQTMAAVTRLKPQKVYFVGFAHRITHELWWRLGRAISSRKYVSRSGQDPRWPKGCEKSLECERYLRKTVQEDGEMFVGAALEEVRGWVEESAEGEAFDVQPAYDGLTVAFDERTGVAYDSRVADEKLKGP